MEAYLLSSKRLECRGRGSLKAPTPPLHIQPCVDVVLCNALPAPTDPMQRATLCPSIRPSCLKVWLFEAGRVMDFSSVNEAQTRARSKYCCMQRAGSHRNKHPLPLPSTSPFSPPILGSWFLSFTSLYTAPSSLLKSAPEL